MQQGLCDLYVGLLAAQQFSSRLKDEIASNMLAFMPGLVLYLHYVPCKCTECRECPN